jgi:hypothetical protein
LHGIDYVWMTAEGVAYIAERMTRIVTTHHGYKRPPRKRAKAGGRA